MALNTQQLEFLATLMSQTRFAHSQRVADMAVTLAKRYGASVEQACLAGLLHDAAKEMRPEDVLALGIEIPSGHTKIISDYFPIWHSFIGPDVVGHLFQCEDDVVKDAIRWHTTGDADMALLSQLLFVADYIEVGRPWECRDYLEELALADLDAATWAVSVLTNQRVRAKKAQLYVASEACELFYRKRVSESKQDDIMVRIQL